MDGRVRTYAVIFAALGIGVNIVLGTIVSFLKVPLLFLDTVGTIFTAAVLGPFYGALTGGVTNVVQGFITNPKCIPFALVNIAVGITVGLIARKWHFDMKTAVITGVFIAILCPLIGTPIAVYVYGGITGDFNDVFFVWLKNSGAQVFTAAFIPRVTGNIVDKVASCVLVAILLKRLPSQLVGGKN